LQALQLLQHLLFRPRPGQRRGHGSLQTRLGGLETWGPWSKILLTILYTNGYAMDIIPLKMHTILS
jgi:hypothetical protein